MKTNISQATLRLLMVLLVLPMAFVNAWGSNTNYYNARMQVKIAESSTGAGLVYVSKTSSSSLPAESNYTAEMQVTGDQKTNDNGQFTFYIYAKPVRGKKFSKWSISNTANNKNKAVAAYDNTSANTSVSTYGAKTTSNGILDFGSTNFQDVVATAYLEDLTSYDVTYKKSDAPYTVSYTYASMVTDTKMETKEYESYTIATADIFVPTYEGDKIVLSTAVGDGFLGWFKEGVSDPIDTHNPCTINAPSNGTATYFPKWTNEVVDVASVNGTHYSSLEEAIAAANVIESGNVNVQLLSYVLYYGVEPIEITRSMTIDLNGKNLYGLAGSMFLINGDGATVTLRDGASTKGKISVIDASGGQFFAVDVQNGTFINNGAAILVQNNLAESGFTENTLTSAIYVRPSGSFTNQSGSLTVASNANSYGICSEGSTSITGGSITVTATTSNANGIFATDGTVAVNGGTFTITAATGANGIVTDGNAQGGAASATITTTTITAKGTTQNAAALRVIDGSMTVNGGTFTVNNTPTGAYGAASGAETITKRKGYPNNGALTINGGTFTATANTSTGAAFGVFVNPSITQPGTNGYVATSITGGKFKMTGKAKGVVNSTAAGMQISGGMYNIDIQALNHIVVGYHSEAIASGQDGYSAGYRFRVVEGNNTDPVCRIIGVDNLEFTTLEAALGYVSNHPGETLRILMLKPYYMSQPGIYTLPGNAGLLLPYTEGQTDYYDMANLYETTYEQPVMYQQLTLGDGVQLNVSGKIEVSGRQYIAGQGDNGAGIPTGAYGQLHLEPGAKIILLNGAQLNAWGFVTGKGEIDARKGSTVREHFQMMDWKGGTISSAMLKSSNPKVFPVNQYFIQNVEAPTTFHPGSALYAITGIYASNIPARANVQIVGVDGDAAMFLMDPAADQDNTWVCKWYDAEHDQQVYRINSSASLGSITIDIEGYSMNSQNYVLPVTGNLKIHLLTGTMGITQSTVMLPGSEIEIDKTSTVAINANQSIYLYDVKQWDKYIFGKKYGSRVKYSPSFNGAPSDVQRKIINANGSSALTSATINVHGTFEVKGAVFTTDGGANIYSTVEDAGTIKFSNTAMASGTIYQPHPNYETVETGVSIGGQGLSFNLSSGYVPASCTSAQLKNENGTYVSTYIDEDSHAVAGQSFCFIDMNDGLGGRWTSLTTDGCFVLDGATGIYYAKPADYVALKNGKTENADHTYTSKAVNPEDERTLILIEGDCQWWEVEYKEEIGLYYCEKNETYYIYDEDNGWIPKKYKVYWQNHNGTSILDDYNDPLVYELPYGSMPFFNSSKPVTRTSDAYYTYDFAGWEPELAPVTKDVTYKALFDRKDRMYTITWNWTDGTAKSKAEYYKVNVTPTPPAEIDMTGKDWNPAITLVTKDQVYTQQDANEDGPFDIKFFNWNGEQIGETQSVAAGEMPTLPAANPTKNPISDMRFEFAGWTPTVAEASANASYTATFNAVPITYTIHWMNEGGAELATDEVSPNTVPQFTGVIPTKEETSEYRYVFAGWDQEIVAATEDATYTAIYNAIPKDMEAGDGHVDITLTESKVTEVTNVIVHTDGMLTVPNTSTLKADNLYLESNLANSGQLIVNPGFESRVQISGNAYFDLKVSIPTHTWYAIAVPWQVDAEGGISVNGRTLEFGKDFDILYYDGATRAANGANKTAWKYMEDEYEEGYRILQPGTLYMIGLMMDAPHGIRFTKKTGANILTTSTSVTAHGGNADAIHNGWNGIANPAVYHAYMNAGSNDKTYGANYGQVYDAEHNAYTSFDMEHRQLVVGQPIFVQVPTGKSIVVNRAEYAPSSAPVRRANAENRPVNFEVSLSATNTSFTDKLIVRLDEDKEDTYVIGQDLAKMGVSSVVPQLWINRYDAKLCMNTQSLTNGVAEYPLSIYAPAAGDYTITNNQSPITNEDYTLYLTLNGQAIWNLSESPYTLTLNKGTATNYGLRISARAPQTATGTDEAIIDAKGETKKVLINDKVYIIREGQLYSVDGRKVK